MTNVLGISISLICCVVGITILYNIDANQAMNILAGAAALSLGLATMWLILEGLVAFQMVAAGLSARLTVGAVSLWPFFLREP